jgi:Protein of unknown function with PCYCGC motif
MYKDFRVLTLTALFLAIGLLTDLLASPTSLPGELVDASAGPTPSPTPHKDPAYHKHPPKGPLPVTLDTGQFKDNPRAYVTYSIAAKIRELLYQEPCFCGCRKLAGHESLLDCFTSAHAVECHACQTEAIFCFEQHKQGKSPKQIRKAMFKFTWLGIDLDQYARDYPATIAPISHVQQR